MPFISNTLFEECFSSMRFAGYQVEVWTLTAPLKHLDSFLFQTFSCRFVGVLGIIVLFHVLFMVDSMTSRCPGLVAAKQILRPPPSCLTVGIRCLWRYASFRFLQTCCCALWAKISTLVSLFLRSCALFRCNIANLNHCVREEALSRQPFQTSHACLAIF